MVKLSAGRFRAGMKLFEEQESPGGVVVSVI